jgi:hypothetical protein
MKLNYQVGRRYCPPFVLGIVRKGTIPRTEVFD